MKKKKFFPQPCLFEPESTDEELRQMVEAATAQTEPHAAPDHRVRATETWWCSWTQSFPV